MLHNSSNFQYNDALNEIKSRLDVIDVVSEYVVLKKSGRNYWGRCPFHQEKTPSFSVNPDKGIFKCFGCGVGGDAISFLQKINNQSFHEVIVELAQRFNIQLPAFGYSSEKNELKNKIHEINLETAKYYTEILLNKEEGRKAKEYLFKRGMDREIIEKFQLGYSLKQADGLSSYLIEKFKVTYDLLDKAGLALAKTSGNGYVDRFRGRIMVPIQDDKGNIIAFGARALEEGQQPKYLNSSDTLVFNKSRSLYALYQAKESIKAQDSVILMEGYFDVISAHAHGLTNVVATLGTALTEHHLKILARYTESRRIYLAFDADDAGINATDRGAEIIKNTFSGLGDIKQFDESYASDTSTNDRSVCEIRIVTIPSGKDPDEFLRTEGSEAYKKLINQAPLLIDYQINRIIKSKGTINSPQEKAHMIKALIPMLSEIKNNIIRDEYVKLVSERLNINEESLTIEIKKSLQTVRSKKAEIKPIVNKNLEKHIFAQKNLLSLYFINNEKVSNLCINNYLKEVNFTEPNLLLIKNEIEKIIVETESAEGITEELLKKVVDNEEAKQQIVDIIFSLDDKKHLEGTLLEQYINENIRYINLHPAQVEQDTLKSSYHAANTDELTALQLQYRVRELIQSNQNRLEIIHEQTN